MSGLSIDPDLWLDGHAEAQQVLRVLPFVKADAHRDALHDLDVVAGGVLRRQQAEVCARRAGEAFHVTVVVAAVSIDVDFHALARPHVPELCLLEVRRDPDVLERHQGHQRLSGHHVLADFHGLLAHQAGDGSDKRGVTEIQLRLLERCLGDLDRGIRGGGARTDHGNLLRCGARRAQLGPGLRLPPARFRHLLGSGLACASSAATVASLAFAAATAWSYCWSEISCLPTNWWYRVRSACALVLLAWASSTLASAAWACFSAAASAARALLTPDSEVETWLVVLTEVIWTPACAASALATALAYSAPARSTATW